MIKVAHITKEFCAPSESFIRDLATELNKDYNLKIFTSKFTLGKSNADLENAEEINFSHPKRRYIRGIEAWARLSRQDPSILEAKYRLQYATKQLEQKLADYSPDLIYSDYGTTAVLLRKVANKLHIPYTVHFHGFDATSALNAPWYKNELPKLVDDAAAIIVPSHHIERLLRIETGTTRHIECIPCGPDLKIVEALKLKRPPSSPVISALGRLTPKKNPLALVEAFKIIVSQLPDAKLEWVGDGELRGEVEQRIKRHGLGNKVKLHGALPHKDALKVVAESNVFMQHSVTSRTGDQEGLPVAILEALAFGIPVVSTIHSGIPEAVSDGVNGFLVREHDYESMANVVINILREEVTLKPDEDSMKKYCLNDRARKVSDLLKKVANTEAVE